MLRFYRFLLTLVLIGFCFSAFTQNVSPDKAQKIAQNFYNERFLTINNASNKTPLNVSDFNMLKLQNNSAYYVFDVKNGGFIIVSAYENVYPVLGYSFDNKFVTPVVCPSFKAWLNYYELQIENAQDNNLPQTTEIKQAWFEYENTHPLNQKDIKAVTPLLLTTWDQNQWYNQMCPADVNGAGGYVYAGCVATSMAQVMKYYNYPIQGSGSHSYNASPYGTQTANFGTTTYRWNEMPLSVTSSNPAVAQLLYHCGVSVNMGYSPTGSSASTTTAATALKNRFLYASSASYKSKYTYTNTNWNNLLKTNLDAGRPMIYSGSPSSGAGHAWNCDGYQGTDHFHMNWGWSGYYNGFFYLNALNAGGDDFSYFQGAVVDIYPGQNYPYFCAGTKTLTGTIGTFDDGSGPSNYQNNSDCYWLIDPTITVSKIKLSFDVFNTESNNDVVTVYDGDNTSAPILGTFSGATIPALMTSNSNKVLVRFQTNATGNLSGWHASYSTVFPTYCVNLMNLTAIADTFTDGSGANNYNPVTTCRWRIAPPGATSITLAFSEFNLPNATDILEVFDVSSGNVHLATYTGTSIPPTQSYNASKIMVWLKTNSTSPGNGFRASYTSVVSGINTNDDIKNINIYPNPAQSNINITLDKFVKGEVNISLHTSNGQKVYEAFLHATDGKNLFVIPTQNFSDGIYFLNVKTDKSLINNKIVIQK